MKYPTSTGALLPIPEISDEYIRIATYDHIKSEKDGNVQVSPNAGKIIEKNFQKLYARIKRCLIPAPILEHNTPSPSPIGQILDVKALHDGIYIKPYWEKQKPTGKYSILPRWSMESLSGSFSQPIHLLSIGIFKGKDKLPESLPSSMSKHFSTKSILENLSPIGLCDRASHRANLVQHHMIETGHPYLRAWQEVKSNNPELF